MTSARSGHLRALRSLLAEALRGRGEPLFVTPRAVVPAAALWAGIHALRRSSASAGAHDPVSDVTERLARRLAGAWEGEGVEPWEIERLVELLAARRLRPREPVLVAESLAGRAWGFAVAELVFGGAVVLEGRLGATWDTLARSSCELRP